MMTLTYSIRVARQEDTHLSIVGSENHSLHYERVTGVQVINILVTSADTRIKPFQIRSLGFADVFKCLSILKVLIECLQTSSH